MSVPSALDRPIALAEFGDPAALQEVVTSFHDFHGVGVALLDLDGRSLARAGAGELPVDVLTAGDPAYTLVPMVHEGTRVGTLVAGPHQPARAAEVAHAAAHMARLLRVLLHSAYARHLTAQLHIATLADTYEQLADKNARLATAVERMQEVDRLKSNFLATVSHELRTPLTSVIGYSEMLLEGLAGALNDEQREYVQTIMEKGDQLLSLITGILDVSRIEAGTLRVARDPVNLDDVIGGALEAMEPFARRKRLAVHVSHARGGRPRALGDRDKIRQVLLNLIGNAIKFTPEGGRVEVSVEVGPLFREDDQRVFPIGTDRHDGDGSHVPLGIRMRVLDNGIGIAPEKQSRIFEPFFQVDSSSTREYGGTGLGLTLVKSYVEAHVGKVWVDSQLGRGSAFTITLPAVDEDLSGFVDGGGATGKGEARSET